MQANVQIILSFVKSGFFFSPSQIQASHLRAVTCRIKLGTCETQRLSLLVMITVSSVTTNTGRYAIWYITHFYVPVNFPFNLPHYVTSYMHHTGKKETKKEIFKKRKKNAPSESVRTKS